MDVLNKLGILTDAAKYDVACTSSGVNRGGNTGMLGSAVAAGICHSFSSDGRCISLFKILHTNSCIYDCKYCANRRSANVPRATLTSEEICELTMNFYRRNYIEGLFLSSAIINTPDYTMEMILKTLDLVRNKNRFNGYIHVKAIPGADQRLIAASGLLADRMSVNIELPSENSLKLLAPEKTKEAILAPMKSLKNSIVQSKEEVSLFKNARKFVPAGQSTQLIVGATPEADGKIVNLAEGLYKSFSLKRVFYSAYLPVADSSPLLPVEKPPLLREHRLYQADWLLRYYGFKAKEILENEYDNLNLNLDPKAHWAIKNIHLFPMEINRVDYSTLLRIPGIGMFSARKIILARKMTTLNFENLKRMGVSVKKARFFITCNGKMLDKYTISPETLTIALSENKIGESIEQISLFDKDVGLLKGEDKKCIPMIV